MATIGNTNDGGNPWETLKKELQTEIDTIQRQMQEIALMLEQSQIEVNKLAQKNASVTARLQQIHGHFDSVPREDIRQTYDASLDAQQRLFIMRGQLEKLQSDHKHLERYKKYLDKIAETFDISTPPPQKISSKGVFSTVEAIIQAQEVERQRLSRQMHDGPAQALSNFILQTEIAMRLFDIDQDKAREELYDLRRSATSAFQQVRDFVFELRPMMLDDLGLVPTLKRYVEAFKEQTGKSARFSVTGVERRLESYIEVIVFRAVQELMGFAVRQSQANHITVQMDVADTYIKVAVEDDGTGVDVDTILESSGMGIKAIKDRVELLGGNMDIDSQPGKGCHIMFQIPVGTTGQPVFA